MNRRPSRNPKDQIPRHNPPEEEPEAAPGRQRGKSRKNRPFPFVTLSAAIQKAVNTPLMRRRLNAIPIAREWRAIVGDAVADHVQPAAFEKGILTLEADSSVWRQQVSFEKDELLKKIAARLKTDEITKIRIR